MKIITNYLHDKEVKDILQKLGRTEPSQIIRVFSDTVLVFQDLSLEPGDLCIIDPNGGDEIHVLLALSGYGTIVPVVIGNTCSVYDNTTSTSLTVKISVLASLLRALKPAIQELCRGTQNAEARSNMCKMFSMLDLSVLEDLKRLQEELLRKSMEFLDT